ncbi:MAG: anti-sigma F factor [Clostridiales bacterium]|nr:anti-sigma F factor [Clostridiales bacterium]
MKNEMEISFLAIAENEALARMVISAFLVKTNPTLSVISEVRTAISEAVTNAIVHAYGDQNEGRVVMRAWLHADHVLLEVEDYGCGIEDVEQAMKPFYTSQPEKERTGMGFSLMQSFMDGVQVRSTVGRGTCVTMTKLLNEDEPDIF